MSLTASASIAEQLLPTPQKIDFLDGQFPLGDPIAVALCGAVEGGAGVALSLCTELRALGVAATLQDATLPRARARRLGLALDSGLLLGDPREGYRLHVAPTEVRLAAPTVAGLRHGAQTLVQLVRASAVDGLPTALGCVQIDDWPGYPVRGLLVDISRDKVPTMDTLRGLVDLLAHCKLNQLQLYMEHTFAYAGHEAVHRDSSPLSGAELRALDDYCAARGIELVPCQQSFGHMHRWLIHEPYRALAECPEGIDHPFSPRREPYSLCPLDPGSLALLEDLYDQLLPHFRSTTLNAGLDETIDLGKGRSASACQARGRGAVYVEFLRQIHRRLAERGRSMQYFGDLVLAHPEQIGALPRDARVLSWGYEAGHPFMAESETLARAGLPFYLCPGTSSWNSLGGRTANMLANIRAASEAGLAHGASGLLVTDWGDNGHLQPLSVSFPGILAAAAAGWNPARTVEAAALGTILDRHVFGDGAGELGRALLDLGRVAELTGCPRINGTVLFDLLLRPGALDGITSARQLTQDGLEESLSALAELGTRLHRSRPTRAGGALVVDELEFVAAALTLSAKSGVARLAAGRDRPLAALGQSTRRTLADQLRALRLVHQRIWRARNREGGLADSQRRLPTIE